MTEPAGNMPEEFCSGNDYILRLQKTRIRLPGAAEEGGPDEVDLITYNGRLVGPTIRAQPGTTLKIKVINALPAVEPALTGAPNQEEPPHDLFTTNLHTHGLHVSPASNSDNVFRVIPPGGSFQYTFTIPADHPTGTFWYHPHKHGSVGYQMANGLAGALIIERRPKGEARDLDGVPEIAAARERILVLQQLILQRDKQGVGWVDPNDVYNEPPRPNAYEATTINGVVLPTYTMQPREVQRWRIIHAGRAGFLELFWHDARGRENRGQAFGEIAVDGLALGSLRLRRTIPLYPGNRSDFLVKAPAQPGEYYLIARQEDESSGKERTTTRRLVKVVVQGPERPMNFPASAALAACKPFPTINPAECRVKRNIVFQYDDQKKIYRINGLSFRQQTSVPEALLGSAEEWTLSAETPPQGSTSEPHPFHIHVNPFQVVQAQIGEAVWKVDEWRDTIAVHPGRKITIRMRFRDFAGKTVFHCHTLDHEDQGMMHTLRIVDPRRPDEDAGEPVAKLTDCRLTAPSLKLVTSQGTNWELNKVRPRSVILVFFRGLGCRHCTEELRKLIQAARSLADTGTELVAVSSEAIADPVAAGKVLKIPAGLRFTLLADQSHTGFRAFGCHDGDPLHGLFLIDPKGVLRARYVGDVPFADAQAVCARVRQLWAGEKP